MLYRETVTQAQLLAYVDDFWLLAVMFAAVPFLLPLMRRIRLSPPTTTAAKPSDNPPAHAPVAEEGAVSSSRSVTAPPGRSGVGVEPFRGPQLE